MPAGMNHVGLRVTDLEKATQFYTAGLGGRLVIDTTLDARLCEYIFKAAPGTTARARGIAWEDGAIEFYEFSPSKPLDPIDQTSVGQMHFCLTVDDVEATYERALANGGKPLFPIMDWRAKYHFVYLTDPDGNVIELLDTDRETWIVEAAVENPTVPATAG